MKNLERKVRNIVNCWKMQYHVPPLSHIRIGLGPGALPHQEIKNQRLMPSLSPCERVSLLISGSMTTFLSLLKAHTLYGNWPTNGCISRKSWEKPGEEWETPYLWSSNSKIYNGVLPGSFWREVQGIFYVVTPDVRCLLLFLWLLSKFSLCAWFSVV